MSPARTALAVDLQLELGRDCNGAPPRFVAMLKSISHEIRGNSLRPVRYNRCLAWAPSPGWFNPLDVAPADAWRVQENSHGRHAYDDPRTASRPACPLRRREPEVPPGADQQPEDGAREAAWTADGQHHRQVRRRDA